MAGKSKITLKLMDFVKIISQEMVKSESITSHIFTSFLYDISDVEPFELIPQIGSTKGQIDYFYLPEKDKDITYVIELKKFNSIKEHDLNLKQINSYLKGNFPGILKSLERLDVWRIGIFTDLRVLVIVFRRSDWGNKSSIFSSKPIVYKLSNLSDLFEELNNLFKMKVGEIAKKILWDDYNNRYQIIYDELNRGKKSELYKKGYDLWIQSFTSDSSNYKGGKGWPKKFETSYSMLLGFKKKVHSAENSLYLNECINVFDKKEFRKLVIELFRNNYSVSFGQGNVKKILEESDL